MTGLLRFLSTLIGIYIDLIIVWAILSFIPYGRGGFLDDLNAVLNKLVLPYVSLFQRFIPSMGGIDFSPILAILVLQLIQRLL